MESTKIHREPDDDRGTVLMTVLVVQCCVALVFLALRLWSRISIRSLGWDDFFMIFTWLLYATLVSMTGIVSSGGGYRHAYYLAPEQLMYVSMLNWLSQPFAIAALGTGKVSVCFLYLRIFGAVSTCRRYMIWFIMILTFITAFLSIVLLFVPCDNVAALWDPVVLSQARCWDPNLQQVITITFQGLNAALDFVVAAFPVTFIWRLHFPLLKRVGLILSLSGGFFSGVCSVFKTQALASLQDRGDFPRATFTLYIWGSCEMSTIILCGCIPTLMPLWDRFERNIRSLVTRKRSGPSDSQVPIQQERCRRPTCMRRANSLDPFVALGYSYGYTDTMVSTLGSKAYHDGSRGSRVSRSASSPNITTVTQNERSSIQVTRSFHIDYSALDTV